MMQSRWRLGCLTMTVLAPLGACVLDAGDIAATDLPDTVTAREGATESLAARPDTEPESPVSGPAAETLAEVEVPTADGKAVYRFRFSRVDGVVLTAMEVPFGHAIPEVPSECALDTFLRVAPADSVVPPALIQHCLTPAERAARGLSAGEASVRAARLRDPASRLEPSHHTAGALCNQEEFDERVGELRALARYVPDVEVCEAGPCTLGAIWDMWQCHYVDANGDHAGACEPEMYFSLLQQSLSGETCLVEGPPSCSMQPNPWCTHGAAAFGDFGPYWAWDRKSEDIFAPGTTTRARVEVSQCNAQEGGPGWWRMKRQPSHAWGAQHPLTFPAGHTSVYWLSAGTEGDLWDGWDFWIKAEGDTVRVISAWVAMEGLNADVCPILF